MKLCKSILLSLLLLPIPTLAATQEAHPTIDVVFVLDTTGSMGGLIQSAKEKIWSIASTLAQGTPTPKIRVGLLAYRDRGDSYITKSFPLTENLDAMFSTLMGYTADGGGDTPESVNQALKEAVTNFEWSQDKGTYKTIFLVGDAPPHMDYKEDVPYTVSLQNAAQKGIIVNTVQCGAASDTERFWREIALKGEGRYAKVDQNGGAASATSPYDDKIAALSRELDETRLYYGDERKQAEGKVKQALGAGIADSAPASSVAGRAIWNASKVGATNFRGDNELVGDITDKKTSLDAVKESDLPSELKSLSKAERQKKVDALSAKRKALQDEITALSEKRQSYLSAQAKASGKDKNSLDAELYKAIQEEGGKKGIIYKDGPVY